MNKESLRIECSRLIMPKTIEEQTELLDIYAELYFNIVFHHQKDETQNEMDEEAKIILQMMMTKILHLKNTTLPTAKPLCEMLFERSSQKENLVKKIQN